MPHPESNSGIDLRRMPPILLIIFTNILGAGVAALAFILALFLLSKPLPESSPYRTPAPIGSTGLFSPPDAK